MRDNVLNIIKWIFKALLASIVAFGILNVIFTFYYYVPYNVKCESGATDYNAPSNFSGYNFEEGFAKINIDSNGYNNAVALEKIDVLCMGSSHTFGYNVFPNQNYVSILNDNIDEKYGWNAYNIGMYGHELLFCLDNFEAAVKEFKPQKYVIIESFDDKLEEERLERLNDGKLGVAGSVVSKPMQKIKDLPYMQIFLHQMKNIFSKNTSEFSADDNDLAADDDFITDNYKKQLDIALSNIEQIADENNVKVIILYHPNILVDNGGSAYSTKNDLYFDEFDNACKAHNIVLLDMTDDYMKAYQDDYIIPRGFDNTRITEGHINKYGHSMIAKKLTDVIIDMNSEEQ